LSINVKKILENAGILIFLILSSCLDTYLFWVAAFIGLSFICLYGNRNESSAYLVPLTAFIYAAVLLISVNAYKTGFYLQGFVLFSFASIALIAYFLIFKWNSGFYLAPKPENLKPVSYLIKVILSVILGVSGWYLLKSKLVLIALPVYFVSFLILLMLWKVNVRISVETEPEDIPLKRYENDSSKMLLASGLFIILCVKVYTAICGYSIAPAVLLMSIGVFFLWYLFSVKESPLVTAKPVQGGYKLADYVIIVILFVLSSYFALKNLMKLPAGVEKDEVALILGIWTNSKGQLGVYDPANFVALSQLYSWFTDLFRAVTGTKVVTLTGYRVAGAVFVPVITALTYLLSRELFGRRIAVLSGLLMVFFLPMQYLGRLNGGGFTHVVALSLAVFLFFVLAIRYNRPVFWLLAGVTEGLNLYFYHPAKLVPVIILLFTALIVLFGKNRKDNHKNLLPGVVLFLSAIVVVFYPMIEYIIKVPNGYFHRLSLDSNIIKTDIVQSVQHYVLHIYSGFMIFFTASEPTGKYSLPSSAVFNDGFSFIFIAGTISLLSAVKSRQRLFMLLWLFVGTLPLWLANSEYGPGFNNWRTCMVFPAMAITAAIGLNDLLELIICPVNKKIGQVIYVLIAAVVIAYITMANYITYFKFYPKDPSVKLAYKSVITEMADEVQKVPNTISLLSNQLRNYSWNGLDIIFADRRIEFKHVSISRIEFDKIYNESGKDIIVIAEGLYADSMDVYKAFFPDAQVKVHYNYEYWMYVPNQRGSYGNLYGWKEPKKVFNYWDMHVRHTIPYDLDKNSKPYVGFVSCRIPYSQIKSVYGLRGHMLNGEKEVIFNGAKQTSENANENSFKVKGYLYAAEGGRYKLMMKGVKTASFAVERKAVRGEYVDLVEGLNKIEIIVQGINESECKMLWIKPMNSNEEAVPPGVLLSIDSVPGLIRTSECNGVKYKAHDYTVRERMTLFDNFPKALLPCPTSLRTWEGGIKIEKAGYYEISFISQHESEAYVDGRKIYSNLEGKEEKMEIYLTKGKHLIKLKDARSSPHEIGGIRLMIRERNRTIGREVRWNELVR